jgi:hypothetical protein
MSVLRQGDRVASPRCEPRFRVLSSNGTSPQVGGVSQHRSTVEINAVLIPSLFRPNLCGGSTPFPALTSVSTTEGSETGTRTVLCANTNRVPVSVLRDAWPRYYGSVGALSSIPAGQGCAECIVEWWDGPSKPRWCG